MPTDNPLGFKYESKYTRNGMICSSEEQNMSVILIPCI